jgi:hypothetical protein
MDACVAGRSLKNAMALFFLPEGFPGIAESSGFGGRSLENSALRYKIPDYRFSGARCLIPEQDV